MEKNSQRVIMISGANRGIGKAIREKLQSENYLLSLGLRNPGAFRDSIEKHQTENVHLHQYDACLLYTSPSPRDGLLSRMPSSA